MASPVADHYSAGTGVPLYAGRYPNGLLMGGAALAGMGAGGTLATGASIVSGDAALAGVAAGGSMLGLYTPAWRSGLTALKWVQIGSNTSYDVRSTNRADVNPNYPSTAPWATLGTQTDLCVTWSGGAWDEDAQRFWLCGGGHAGYDGNEPYTIDLNVDSPAWVMRGYPTGSIQRPVANVRARKVGDSEVGQDGRPISMHTYDLLCTVADGRLFMGYGGFCYDSSGTAVAEFDPATDDWDMSTGRYTISDATAVDVTGSVCWDAGRGKIWQVSGSRIASWSRSTKTVTRHRGDAGGVTGVLLRRMPEHDLLVAFSNASSTLGSGKHVAIIDPTAPGDAPVGINADTVGWGSTTGGVCYDTKRKRFLRWAGGGGVDTLTPPVSSPKSAAWTYGSLSTDTSIVTPGSAQANGTYGRVVYSERYDCLLVCNATDTKLYCLPLS